MRYRYGTASFLHSREGVMQWDLLEMITYGIGILPLIKKLKQEIPGITQPLYAEDSGELGKLARIILILIC